MAESTCLNAVDHKRGVIDARLQQAAGRGSSQHVQQAGMPLVLRPCRSQTGRGGPAHPCPCCPSTMSRRPRPSPCSRACWWSARTGAGGQKRGCLQLQQGTHAASSGSGSGSSISRNHHRSLSGPPPSPVVHLYLAVFQGAVHGELPHPLAHNALHNLAVTRHVPHLRQAAAGETKVAGRSGGAGCR